MPHSIRTLDLSAVLGKWTLSTAAPCEELSHVVKEFWEVRGDIDAFREAVLPNGHVEVMFNLGPPHRVLDGAGEGLWHDAWYSGLHERAINIETLHGTHLLSARLHPLGAAMLFGERVAHYANNIVSLTTLAGDEARQVRERLIATSSVEQHFKDLEAWLLGRLHQSHEVPAFIRDVTRELDATHGNARIAELHERLGISRKHLAVTFKRYFGITPKQYALTQRFVWTLEHLQRGETFEWSTLALSAGYFDQSHLVRDFKRVGAASPLEYVRRALPGASALLET